MYPMGLVLGACTAMIATALGAAGVLAFKRVDSRFPALALALSAGMMVFAVIEMLNASHSMLGHRMALASLLVGMLAFYVMDKVCLLYTSPSPRD